MNTLGHCTFAGMRYSSFNKLRDAYDVEPHELADATVFFRTFAEALNFNQQANQPKEKT